MLARASIKAKIVKIVHKSRKALPALLCPFCRKVTHCRKPVAMGSPRKCRHCGRTSLVEK